MTIDPICGMEVDEEEAGKKYLLAEKDGKKFISAVKTVRMNS